MTIEDQIRAIVREELARSAPAADYLTTSAAAEIASVSPATVRRWIASGLLAVSGVGRAVRIRRADLDALLATSPTRTRRIASPKLTPEQVAARDFKR